MSPRRRAQLLLPTPLGLVEYDVLEDTAFVGPGARGGLTANPAPFKEAVAALTAVEGGLVIRALPGEAAPIVNGAEGEGQILVDGDKITLGGRVVAFKAPRRKRARAAPAAPAASNTAPVGERRAGRTRKPVTRTRPNPWITAISLAGALLFLVGLYLALDRLGNLRAGENVTAYVPDPPKPPEWRDVGLEPPALAYREVEQYEKGHPDDLDGSLERYRDYARRFPASPEADRARTRIRELYDRAGALALTALQEKIDQNVRDEFFATALKAVRRYERKYGATPSGEDIDAIRRYVRARARKTLDALLRKIGPLVNTRPRMAHRALLAASPEYPPDMAAEITGQMERAIQLMKTRGAAPSEEEVDRRPAPVGPGMHPRDAPPPRNGDGGKDDVFTEASAFNQWKEAYADLRAGRYKDALQGYSLLVLRYGDSETVKQHRKRIVAGRFAAKVGHEGPAGLLSVPCEMKRGRLEVEYGFDDASVVQRDFTIEQPFPSDRPITWKPHRGAIRMQDATGLFHVIVWEPDVRIEARVVAEVAHDFGILAVDDRDEYRAVMLNINNTLFTLKKGAAARTNPGHLLWFMGQGVWADADADYIGYIKIAERSSVKLENADRLTMELMRKGDACEGGFHGRTDGVNLKGKVQGDDAGGLGPARVGLFVNTGIIVVEEIKISGKVDMKWFRTYVADLVDATRGPED